LEQSNPPRPATRYTLIYFRHEVMLALPQTDKLAEFSADSPATARRIGRLQAYFEEQVLTNGQFICSTYQQCKESHRGPFYAGQLPHVGTHYDLMRNGDPFRIVVVGQEYGEGPELVDLNARRATIVGSSGAKKFASRNPHMRGCTSILRLLFGKELGRDREGEFVQLDGTAIHLFDCFALVNFLLCSAVLPGGSKKGRSTSTMQRNCARHFGEQLELLEPTVIVIQGVNVLKWMKKAGFDTLSHEVDQTVQINGRATHVLAFTHPAAYGKDNWGISDQTQYLREKLEPAVKGVLREWDTQPGAKHEERSSGRTEVKYTLGWKKGDPIQKVNLRCTKCGYFAQASNEMLSRGRLKCPVDGEMLATKEERGEKKGRW
jgi:hypothetical protein